jgi:hypothetical protein
LAGVNVKELEGSGFLIIMDSYAAFLGFQQDNELFFSRLVSHAIVSLKSGICIIADMGAFFLIDRVAALASGRMEVRGFARTTRRTLKRCPRVRGRRSLARATRRLLYNKLHKSYSLCNCQAA